MAAGVPGACRKYLLGHGIVGVENLGGDLDKVSVSVFASTVSRCAGTWVMAPWLAVLLKLMKMISMMYLTGYTNTVASKVRLLFCGVFNVNIAALQIVKGESDSSEGSCNRKCSQDSNRYLRWKTCLFQRC